MGGALALLACSAKADAVFDCGVCFYGTPKDFQMLQLYCPVQCHFGAKDTTANFADLPTAMRLAEVLQQSASPFELHIYEEAQHGFMHFVPC
jgi:dienelactone hydrolase